MCLGFIPCEILAKFVPLRGKKNLGANQVCRGDEALAMRQKNVFCDENICYCDRRGSVELGPLNSNTRKLN